MPRYSDLHPTDLEHLIAQGFPAIVPIGALEWHGDHLPLGLDGIVAEWFCEQLAGRVRGVLLPGIWLPITTLPHRLSLQVQTDTFRKLVAETVEGLSGAGFSKVALVTGHYAQGHLWELYDLAAKFTNDSLRVFTATPLQPLNDDQLLDHAGEHETSQLLAIRPDLVRTEALPDKLDPKAQSVLGEHPRKGNKESGTRLLEAGLMAWQAWLSAATAESLLATYNDGQISLEGYRSQFFKSSWEQAIQDWWASK